MQEQLFSKLHTHFTSPFKRPKSAIEIMAPRPIPSNHWWNVKAIKMFLQAWAGVEAGCLTVVSFAAALLFLPCKDVSSACNNAIAFFLPRQDTHATRKEGDEEWTAAPPGPSVVLVNDAKNDTDDYRVDHTAKLEHVRQCLRKVSQDADNNGTQSFVPASLRLKQAQSLAKQSSVLTGGFLSKLTRPLEPVSTEEAMPPVAA
eukprot:1160260-Pelagomonas_calceolata.AAC.3